MQSPPGSGPFVPPGYGTPGFSGTAHPASRMVAPPGVDPGQTQYETPQQAHHRTMLQQHQLQCRSMRIGVLIMGG